MRSDPEAWDRRQDLTVTYLLEYTVLVVLNIVVVVEVVVAIVLQGKFVVVVATVVVIVLTEDRVVGFALDGEVALVSNVLGYLPDDP